MKHFALALLAMLMLQGVRIHSANSMQFFFIPDDTTVVKKDSANVQSRHGRHPGAPGNAPEAKKWLEGVNIRKVIFIPKKIINIVVG